MLVFADEVGTRIEEMLLPAILDCGLVEGRARYVALQFAAMIEKAKISEAKRAIIRERDAAMLKDVRARMTIAEIAEKRDRSQRAVFYAVRRALQREKSIIAA